MLTGQQLLAKVFCAHETTMKRRKKEKQSRNSRKKMSGSKNSASASIVHFIRLIVLI